MYVFGICLEGLRETTKNLRIGCVSAEVRTRKLQNTAPRSYRYNYLLGLISFQTPVCAVGLEGQLIGS